MPEVLKIGRGGGETLHVGRKAACCSAERRPRFSTSRRLGPAATIWRRRARECWRRDADRQRAPLCAHGAMRRWRAANAAARSPMSLAVFRRRPTVSLLLRHVARRLQTRYCRRVTLRRRGNRQSRATATRHQEVQSPARHCPLLVEQKAPFISALKSSYRLPCSPVIRRRY